MPKEKTPQEVYDELVTKGSYEEAHLDKDEVRKVKNMAIEDYEFGKTLRKIENPNYRIIFNIHYDVLRELCDQLMRFENQKISNHKGLFAFIILNFPDLGLDWNFLERIRTIRNQNKYQGTDITKEMWMKAELQMDLYISAIKKELKEKLDSIA